MIKSRGSLEPFQAPPRIALGVGHTRTNRGRASGVGTLGRMFMGLNFIPNLRPVTEL